MATKVEPGVEGGLSDDDVLALYRALLTSRLIEEKMLVLVRQGRLTKWFSSTGSWG